MGGWVWVEFMAISIVLVTTSFKRNVDIEGMGAAMLKGPGAGVLCSYNYECGSVLMILSYYTFPVSGGAKAATTSCS